MLPFLLSSGFFSKIEGWSLVATLLVCLGIAVVGVVICVIISLIRKAAAKKDKKDSEGPKDTNK